MQDEIRSTTILEFGATDTVEFSGSIELNGATAVDIAVVVEGVPAAAFELDIQLQQSLDNLSFFDSGPSMSVDSLGVRTQRVSHILAAFARLKMTLTSLFGGDPVVFSITMSRVPSVRETAVLARSRVGTAVPGPAVPIGVIGPSTFGSRRFLRQEELPGGAAPSKP